MEVDIPESNANQEDGDMANLQAMQLSDGIEAGTHISQDNNEGLQLALIPEEVNPQPIQAIPPTLSTKRKSRKRATPVVMMKFRGAPGNIKSQVLFTWNLMRNPSQESWPRRTQLC